MIIRAASTALLASMLAMPVKADVVSTGDCFPLGGRFDTPSFTLQGFGSCITPPPSGTATHSFTAELTGTFNPGAVILSQVIAFITISITYAGSGIYDTELTQLDTTGTTRIRESPTQPSNGQATITPESGLFRINSFFDVFVELSLDNGDTWIPVEPAQERLILNPEPSTFAMGGTALALLGFLARRRRRAGLALSPVSSASADKPPAYPA
jgi:hypothetical protein